MLFSFNELFTFVLYMSKKYNIDTSHSESHSMDVLHYAHNIYESELDMFPELKQQTNVIYAAAILHDMCDKKYVDESIGIIEIEKFLEQKMSMEEIHYTKEIISTMSYSTVKKQGYPDLNDYQLAYHIVREADLLSSYDFDRTMIYHMHKGNSLTKSYKNSLEIFHNRVLNYNKDKLLLSDYSQKISAKLSLQAVKRMLAWNKILIK